MGVTVPAVLVTGAAALLRAVSVRTVVIISVRCLALSGMSASAHLG